MKAKLFGFMQICAGWVGLLFGAIIGGLFDLYFYGDVGIIMSYATFIGAVTGIMYTVVSLQAVLKQHQMEENLG
ncbi:hypothetical protein [Candidatus Albibeggiatoa sp. nov. NOAA]|uniref:hypothetical protein n=1 Tax=Candidatus Albibeggiatoa sp. nov. NOAA TaxID=3162724 RepID=UPI003301D62A|nr:hypothetical protein [Thiotrichaceae bacterium]